MHRTRRPLIAAIVAALAGALLLAGCTTTDSAANPIADEFAASQDRAPSAATLYAMARILVSRGQDRQAAYVLRRIITEYPERSEAYNALAELHMRHDEVDAAVATLDAGLAATPHHARLHNNRGMASMIRGEYADARAHFDRAVELAPRHARYHGNRATAAGLAGDYDAALAGFLACLTPSEAHHNLAVICEARGDHERAALERRLAAAPE